MSKPEVIQGTCEVCHEYVGNDNLYVDLINNIYALECPRCFYESHEGNVRRYYEKIKEVKPDIYSEAQFNKHAKAYIVIANAFPFITADKLSEYDRDKYSTQSVKNFLETPKMIKKFRPIEVRMKHTETGGVFIVSVTAKVQFKSYLEFLEHELYMLFRKENQSIFS